MWWILLVFIIIVLLSLYITDQTSSVPTFSPSFASPQRLVITLTKPALPRKITTVKLQGGLGNQLFQVSAGLAHAYVNHRDFKIDKSLTVIEGIPQRPTYFMTYFRNVPGLNQVNQLAYDVYTEKRFDYDPIPPYQECPVVELLGYFQSEKYFDMMREELISLFCDDLIPRVKLNVPQKSENNRLVSMHIRRSDYLNSTMHVQQNLEYYVSAIKTLKALFPHTNEWNVLVFSDDLNWCREHLPDLFPNDTFFYSSEVIQSSDDTLREDEKDLLAMSLCEDKIIANSSFSWWGAYLSTVPGTVIAPKNWFNSEEISNWNDVYCKDWIVI